MTQYLKYSVKGYFVELDQPLSPELYNIGSTWEDFLDNKWLQLSDEQVVFREMNPKASAKEVWNLELNTPRMRTLEDAKHEKLKLIEEYDNSSSVNGFTINGVIETWFSVQERLNYKESINAAKILGKDEVSFFVGDTLLSVGCDLAVGMLAQVQDYADQCYIITKQHKMAVEAMESIEDVDAFDYAAGYPQRLNFDLA